MHGNTFLWKVFLPLLFSRTSLVRGLFFFFFFFSYSPVFVHGETEFIKPFFATGGGESMDGIDGDDLNDSNGWYGWESKEMGLACFCLCFLLWFFLVGKFEAGTRRKKPEATHGLGKRSTCTDQVYIYSTRDVCSLLGGLFC
ncbi:hypothetical protein QBC42DRAFT_56113 [Cladorrhinum samala]|uniref:Uncharacterized protein n=1 Tax=Cladorrhinum samala TaxID=585594 RepID=A0AAV9HTI5_9PEZI|nr:hypothetical protein QBC42DRAFT_56113 [Cladorrhinum samala]